MRVLMRHAMRVVAAIVGLAMTPAMGAGVFPATVEHALGTTIIPAEPRRVVALIDRDVDTLLALGVVPVAIRSQFGFEAGVGEWAVERLGGAKPAVWIGRELNIEAIAAARPDLIVFANSDGDPAAFDLLSAIAPTIPLPKGAKPWEATTEQTTLAIAEALGRKADGQKLLDDLDAYLAARKAAYPMFEGKSVTYLDIYPGGVSTYSKDHIVNGMMYKVGFSPNRAALEMPAGETSQNVSAELLHDFDADVVVYYPFGRTVEEISAEMPTFATLDSVKTGRAFMLEDLAFSNASVLSIPYALDRLLPKVAKTFE